MKFLQFLLIILISGLIGWQVRNMSRIEDYQYDDDPAHYGIQFVNMPKAQRVIILYDKDKQTVTDVLYQAPNKSDQTLTVQP